MTVSELIEALEKAHGPDRKLDHEIYSFVRPTNEAYEAFATSGDYDNHWYWMFVREYTASIDAAVSLAMHVLPDANCWGIDKDERGIEAHVQRNGVKSGHWAQFAEHRISAPIALVVATLKALRSRGFAKTRDI